ncbi:MAG: carboxypeptidase-like regulatory domain-containing protein [Saprospiraceae bacterium]|nr:carboxypeptidase-like regulatory domain-containing protein [Saprospiraceae bacterium]
MKYTLTFLFYLFISNSLLVAQIKGKVTDSDGNPIPYTAVYIKNSTKGTSTNLDGYYELNLNPGLNTLVFHYLGYQIQEIQVDFKNEPIILDLVLYVSVYSLGEVVVSSDQEDPAYEIIRKAISKRNYFLKLNENHTCNAYTKGLIKITDAPKKILGQEIGTMDNNLDTNRQGIIYLSETVSRLHFQKPDYTYEEMISSIISGRDNGFSFNRATSANFNLYENITSFGKGIVSPIADYAFEYYTFKLLSIDTSNIEAKLLYKIEVRPKIRSLAAWSGILSIHDETWSIQSFNLQISGSQIQQPLFDTIYLSQLFIPVSTTSQNLLQNQVFGFKANLLGIKFEGKFVVVFSDYNFANIHELENEKIILQIAKGANEKTKQYWDSIRPIPLTKDEIKDYTLKDSIKLIRESKSYKDSIDHRNNKFNFSDLFLGYSYQKTMDRSIFSINSPIELYHFNPIQGWAIGSVLKFSKYLIDANDYNRFFSEMKLDYGFAEQKFRPSLLLQYQFNTRSKSFIQLAGGLALSEFNNFESSKLFEELSNLLIKKNYLKYYEKQFYSIAYGRYLNFDWRWKSNIEYSYRSEVVNHSNYSWRKKSLTYQANNQADYFTDSLHISKPQHIQLTNSIAWNPGTRVEISPNQINLLESDNPRFFMTYAIGSYLAKKEFYHKFEFSVSDNFRLSKWGELNAFVKVNKIFHKHTLDSPDFIFQHENGLFLYNKPNRLDFFIALYPYAYSTDRQSASWFLEYDMQGFILDRIPLINRLGLKELVRYASVMIPNSNPYSELSLGFGNIGYKLFRVLRLDWVHSFYGSSYGGSYLKLGLLTNVGIGN